MSYPKGCCTVCGKNSCVLHLTLYGTERIELCLGCALSLLQHLVEDCSSSKVRDAIAVWRLWHRVLTPKQREEFKEKDWPEDEELASIECPEEDTEETKEEIEDE